MSLSPPMTVQAPQAASRAGRASNAAGRASLSESRVREGAADKTGIQLVRVQP